MDLASLGLRLQCDRHSSSLNDLASPTSPTVKRNFFRYTTMVSARCASRAMLCVSDAIVLFNLTRLFFAYLRM